MNQNTTTLGVGTRGSELALVQAETVLTLLEKNRIGGTRRIISTRGDMDQVSHVPEMGESRIFIREIEAALIRREIDLAVHSLKDLPVELPDGLCLASVPERCSPMDAMISRNGRCLHELSPGSRIATGSPRRSAQVLTIRPDLQVVPIRGNVPTRIRKMHEGFCDAVILASAGLQRLDRENEITEVFDIETLTPAMGQGAIAIEARTGEYQQILETLNDPDSRHAVDLERAFIRELGAGCNTPVGIHARFLDRNSCWQLTGMIGSADGKSIMRRTILMDPDPECRLKESRTMAQGLIQMAGPELIRNLNLKPPAP